MIIGIGIDLVSVTKMEFDLKNRPEDFESVFTPEEVIACTRYRDEQYQSFAARFAAKEAFIKAIDQASRFLKGWEDKDRLSNMLGEIELQTDQYGRPEIILRGSLAEATGRFEKMRWLVSVSHEQDMAIAMVIIERI